jgi:hypothetical protein
MPTYNFKNTETGKTFTEFMPMAELDTYLAANPHIMQLPSAPALVDPYHLGRQKAPGSFRNLLSRMKKKHRGSTIDSGNISEV